MGMDALYNENDSGVKPKTLRITQLYPNKEQPRTDFNHETLASLSESIKQHGVLQPLLVRPMEDGNYQIVAGERRWRAARMAGLEEVPVIIKELSDRETMEMALVENLQRENLNPVEEALGYKELMDRYGYTQEQVAKIVGRSRPVIANALRLLTLDELIITSIRDGVISPSHAKVLCGGEDPKEREVLAARIKKDILSVRELEELIRKSREAREKKIKLPKKKDVFLREIEISLAELTGRKVVVTGKNRGGKIEIEYYNKDDLTRISSLLENLKSL